LKPAKENLASPTPASWNQIASWLKQIDNLRQALDEIWEYIAEDNVDAATGFSPISIRPSTTLAGSPQIGHRRPDLTTQSLRFHVVG